MQSILSLKLSKDFFFFFDNLLFLPVCFRFIFKLFFNKISSNGMLPFAVLIIYNLYLAKTPLFYPLSNFFCFVRIPEDNFDIT